MPIDLSKLAPAPWKARDCEVESAPINEKGDVMMIYDEGGHNEADAAFIALARNAFDVMMRRGWFAAPHQGGWNVLMPMSDTPRADCVSVVSWYKAELAGRPFTNTGGIIGPDPFTALIEADAWYKQNVDADSEREAWRTDPDMRPHPDDTP